MLYCSIYFAILFTLFLLKVSGNDKIVNMNDNVLINCDDSTNLTENCLIKDDLIVNLPEIRSHFIHKGDIYMYNAADSRNDQV
jgi:hypothetical protein